MRFPTEYILTLVSIGALYTIAFNAVTVPFLPEEKFLEKEQAIAITSLPSLEGTAICTEPIQCTLFSLAHEGLLLAQWGKEGEILQESANPVDPPSNRASEKNTGISVARTSLQAAEIQNETNDAPPKSTVAVAPPSPLQLEKLYHFSSSLQANEPISFAVTVRNNTDSKAPTSTLLLGIDTFNDGIINVELARRNVEPLTPLETYTETWKNVVLTRPGTHRALSCIVIAPFEGTFAAAQKCTSLDFTLEPQPADLVVQSISISPENPIADNWLSISGNIKNQGKGEAAPSLTRIRIDAQNNGSFDLVSEKQLTSSLVSGDETSQEWNTVWRAIQGFFRVEICTDQNREVMESHEENNCRISIFHAKPRASVGAESVTFFVEDGKLSPPSHSVIPGGSIIFSNFDSESYFITGTIGSILLEPNTQVELVAPFYTGTYIFYSTYGTAIEGSVVVE